MRRTRSTCGPVSMSLPTLVSFFPSPSVKRPFSRACASAWSVAERIVALEHRRAVGLRLDLAGEQRPVGAARALRLELVAEGDRARSSFASPSPLNLSPGAGQTRCASATMQLAERATRRSRPLSRHGPCPARPGRGGRSSPEPPPAASAARMPRVIATSRSVGTKSRPPGSLAKSIPPAGRDGASRWGAIGAQGPMLSRAARASRETITSESRLIAVRAGTASRAGGPMRPRARAAWARTVLSLSSSASRSARRAGSAPRPTRARALRGLAAHRHVGARERLAERRRGRRRRLGQEPEGLRGLGAAPSGPRRAGPGPAPGRRGRAAGPIRPRASAARSRTSGVRSPRAAVRAVQRRGGLGAEGGEVLRRAPARARGPRSAERGHEALRPRGRPRARPARRPGGAGVGRGLRGGDRGRRGGVGTAGVGVGAASGRGVAPGRRRGGGRRGRRRRRRGWRRGAPRRAERRSGSGVAVGGRRRRGRAAGCGPPRSTRTATPSPARPPGQRRAAPATPRPTSAAARPAAAARAARAGGAGERRRRAAGRPGGAVAAGTAVRADTTVGAAGRRHRQRRHVAGAARVRASRPGLERRHEGARARPALLRLLGRALEDRPQERLGHRRPAAGAAAAPARASSGSRPACRPRTARGR